MSQAKKRKSTRTAKKATTRKSGSQARRTTKSAKTSTTEKWHVYIMTALSMVLAILLCAEAAIFAVL